MSHDTDKLIRQLSLVAFLMAERRPLTTRDIKGNVEGYQEMSDEAFARRFAEVFDLSVRPPPFANTELAMTLVWSHVRATDPILIWFRELLREVVEPVYQGSDRSG